MVKVGGIESGDLRDLISRVEKLEEEKRELAAEIRDVYAEAKSRGFDAKIIRQIIKLRKLDADEAAEQELLLDLYRRALGMIPELDK